MMAPYSAVTLVFPEPRGQVPKSVKKLMMTFETTEATLGLHSRRDSRLAT